MEHNSDLQIRLRRNQNTLVVIGFGVIAFGIWSVIKTVLGAALNLSRYLDPIQDAGVDRWVIVLVFWIMLGIMLAFDLGLRLYVGFSAVAEGRGTKHRRVYIGLAVLMAIFSFATLAVSLSFHGSNTEETVSGAIAAFVVELTSGVTLIEMAVSAIKVKRLRRMLAEQEG